MHFLNPLEKVHLLTILTISLSTIELLFISTTDTFESADIPSGYAEPVVGCRVARFITFSKDCFVVICLSLEKSSSI